MNVTHHTSLQRLHTFGLDVQANTLVTVHNEQELEQAFVRFPDAVVMGEGSNMVFAGDVAQPIVRPAISGRVIDGDKLHAAAGENWHALVTYATERRLSGIENLALIPGSAGAGPVQNIGAYGQELSDVLASVRVFDRGSHQFYELTTKECLFGYRDSLFKRPEGQHLVITGVSLQLSRQFAPNLSHADLERYFSNGAGPNNAADIAAAVTSIRRRKLPDPAVTGNAGSFFKNPVVPETTVQRLLADYPDMPHWQAESGTQKLSAGWLVEQAGLKGVQQGRVAVSSQHALVLVNQGGAAPDELLALTRFVVSEVESRFGIRLQREPVLI